MTDVVLINGIGGAPEILRPLRDRLPGTVWQPPHRGLAPSALELPHELTSAQVVELLVEDLVRQVERPAVLVAWSGGAKLAALLAARVPERIVGLCCVNGAFHRVEDPSRTARLGALAARLSSGPVPGPLLERIVELIALHAEPPRAALLADLADREGAAFVDALFRPPARPGGAATLAFPALRDAASILNYLRLVAALASVDVEDVLARTPVPLLLIAGADDQIVGADASRRIAAAVPGATYVELADATHYAVLEHPDAIAGAIGCRAWLSMRTVGIKHSATTTS